jgi:hypothetical protein
MTPLRVFWSRFVGIFRRNDSELDEEIQTHLDLLARENVERGMSPEAARAAARRSFGGVMRTTEACRDQRGWPLIDSLFQDVRFAVRLLAQRRAYTATAVLALGLGIGVNNTLYPGAADP